MSFVPGVAAKAGAAGSINSPGFCNPAGLSAGGKPVPAIARIDPAESARDP